MGKEGRAGRADKGPKQRLIYINIRMMEIREEMTKLNEERKVVREQLGKQRGAESAKSEDDDDDV